MGDIDIPAPFIDALRARADVVLTHPSQFLVRRNTIVEFMGVFLESFCLLFLVKFIGLNSEWIFWTVSVSIIVIEIILTIVLEINIIKLITFLIQKILSDKRFFDLLFKKEAVLSFINFRSIQTPVVPSGSMVHLRTGLLLNASSHAQLEWQVELNNPSKKEEFNRIRAHYAFDPNAMLISNGAIQVILAIGCIHTLLKSFSQYSPALEQKMRQAFAGNFMLDPDVLHIIQKNPGWLAQFYSVYELQFLQV